MVGSVGVPGGRVGCRSEITREREGGSGGGGSWPRVALSAR